MSDRDIMQRLLDTEREASRLVAEAEEEARRRLQAASDEQKRAAFDAIQKRRKQLEAELEELKTRLREDQKRALSAYDSELTATPVDSERFHREIDQLIGRIGEEGSM